MERTASVKPEEEHVPTMAEFQNGFNVLSNKIIDVLLSNHTKMGEIIVVVIIWWWLWSEIDDIVDRINKK